MRMSSLALVLILVPHGNAGASLGRNMSEALALVAGNRASVERERQRDHDERLKRRWAALATRSCEDPGSVSQSELNALPLLYKREPIDVMLLFGSCGDRVYWRLYNGDSAEAIRIESLPLRAASPAPIQRPAEVVAGNTLESVLPKLNEFAEIACKYQGQVSPARDLFTPRAPYLILTGDEAAASRLTAGLDGCRRHLFRRLYEVVRSGRGDQITRQWLVDTVASTPAAAEKPAKS